MSRRRKLAETTPFDTFKLEGTLFVPELLERAARGEASAQQLNDYGVPKGLKFHDEYGRAFRIAAAVWQDFTTALPRTDVDPASPTTAFVSDLLRQCLGYSDLSPTTAPVQIGDRGFPIATQATGERLPIIIAPHTLGLDDPDPRFAIHGSGARRKSAHQLAQEFLNASRDALWAIVTNGRTLRLLRDAETLTRPNFLEFDLETIFREGEDRYADFAALWRILHASRAGSASAPAADCTWEKWRAEGHSQGLRVREGLRVGVTQALLILGSGFLRYPGNDVLRLRLHEGILSKEAYFQQLLRLVYRSLFLFCAEERDLLNPPDASPEARQAYSEGYSLRRLRSRSLRQSAYDPHGDLWLSLCIVFRALATGQPRLALPALGGLFTETQCPDLDKAGLANRDLLATMWHLRWSDVSGTLTAIDYRNMGPEELGSVYESLLELVPQLDLPGRTFGFIGITDAGSTSGNARKITGSYYTPDLLVQELIKSALDPVIEQRIKAQPDRPVEALLAITVCDPACGSGHFLLAAARRLAEKLAELRAPDGAVRPDDYRHALREVIARCIHGVDRNPLALELARTVLWLEGVEPGLPLSFLDHHLVCGDALLGLADLRQMEKGIPDDAFNALSGDDKKLCSTLKKQNKVARKQFEDLRQGQDLISPAGQPDALAEFSALEGLPETTPQEVAAKEAAWLAFLSHTQQSPLARAADVFVGAFLAPKAAGSNPPDTRALAAALFPAKSTPELAAQIEQARMLCDRDHAKVLHWPLAFPKIFARGGFDCILGNPPWERIKLQEEEFFATREPLIKEAKNKAERSKRIQWLSEGSLHYHLSQFQTAPPPDQSEVALFHDFKTEKRLAEATSLYAHLAADEGGRYPLTGVGDVNTYALFSETISQLTSCSGRSGFIVPMGIATDDTTKEFFGSLITHHRLTQLIGLFEIRAWFPATDDRKAFCLLTLGDSTKSRFIFDVKVIEDLQQDAKWIELPPEDLILINPNTRTCPIFRSRTDAELTRAIYRRLPVLIEDGRDDKPGKNPWGIRFQAMFHMSGDSGLFHEMPGIDLVPLYEAKMIHQFDHRWAGYGDGGEEDEGSGTLTLAQKQAPNITATPRYWVHRSEVDARLLDRSHALFPLFEARLSKRRDSLAWWFRLWLWGQELAAGRDDEAAFLRREMDDARMVSHNVLELAMLFEAEKTHAVKMASEFPLEHDEQLTLWTQIKADKGLHVTGPDEFGAKSSDNLSPHWMDLAERILPKRGRRWLMGWRDICRTTDERTVIASVIPRVATGDTLLLMFPSQPAHLVACLLADQNSLVHDFIARQKIGGTHLKYHVKKQITNLPPDAYTEADLAYIMPRVLEITYTAHDLRPWAEDVIASYHRQFPNHPPLVPDPVNPEPFPFDPDRRAILRAELDARYALLYGLTRDELRYILDPADTHGPDYPSETFRVLKNNELRQFGEYRTQRLVLAAWDQQAGPPEHPHTSGRHISWDTIRKGQGMNRFLLNPRQELVTYDASWGEKSYLARVSQVNEEALGENNKRRTFFRLEAFSERWFRENRPPQGEIPWANAELFVGYYGRAELFQLEVETIPQYAQRFPSLLEVEKAAVEGTEPATWYRIRAGGPVGAAPIGETVPIRVFQNLLGEGLSFSLEEFEELDAETQRALDRAVSTGHIAKANRERLESVFARVTTEGFDWVTVYDVGQGNAIGLYDSRHIVRCYFDLGGGCGPNLRTYPLALTAFCFTTSPPIILSHWDEDHWSSALRDRRALAQTWIAPQQAIGPVQMALIASIASTGGELLFVDPASIANPFGPIRLELCTGSGRNHSGIAMTLSKQTDGGEQHMLFPGDADYRHVPSFRGGRYLSVVAPHHGSKLLSGTTPSQCPQVAVSRLVYSYGPNNTYRHPARETRVAHDDHGWRDAELGTAHPTFEVRNTATRSTRGLGHVLLGWQPQPAAPELPCGRLCNLRAEQM